MSLSLSELVSMALCIRHSSLCVLPPPPPLLPVCAGRRGVGDAAQPGAGQGRAQGRTAGAQAAAEGAAHRQACRRRLCFIYQMCVRVLKGERRRLVVACGAGSTIVRVLCGCTHLLRNLVL
eukprot:5852241-Pleurochrysis_carterae.AAC.4